MPSKEKAKRILNELSLKGNILSIKIRGSQEGQSNKTLRDIQKIIQELKNSQRKIFLIVDLSSVRLEDIQSSSRLAIKEALKQPFEAIAAYGQPELAELAIYLISETRTEHKARYFFSKKAAERWIQITQKGEPARQNTVLFAAVAIIIVSLLGMIGWALDFPILNRLAPTFKPLNPMSTLSLLIVSLGLFSVWKKNSRLMAASVFGLMIFGTIALLPNNFGFDYLLFHDRLKDLLASGVNVEISDSSAATLIGIGVLLTIQRVRNNPVPFAYIILSSSLFLFSVFNIFGTMYAPDFTYSLGPNFAMPIPFALAASITLIVLGLDAIEFHWGKNITSISKINWLIVTSLVIIQFITYGGWLFTTSRVSDIALGNYKNRINDIKTDMLTRMNAYTDELNGFKALFASSNYINQGEFDAYYKNSLITENYPGILTSAYIAKVDSKNLPAFIAQRRADSSFAPGFNKNFTIQQQSTKDTHYISTYVVGEQYAQSLGTDYADAPERASIYKKAAETNQLAASGTIYIPAEKTNGFFITVPVKNTGQAGNGSQINGFVNAAFRYDRLFANSFQSSHLADEIAVSITDSSDGSLVFSSSHIKKSRKPLFSSTIPIKVADHNWNIEVKVPTNFGVDNFQKTSPFIILASGQILAVLVIVIFVIQNSSRRRAIQLAEIITEDLKRERDRAISTERRNEVMLSSIADGLVIFNEDLDIIRVNNTATKLLGMQPHEMIGKHFSKVLHATTDKDIEIPASDRDIQRTFSNKHATKGELKYRRKDGTYFDAQYTCAPIIIQDKVRGVVEIFRDITQEKILDRAKTDFVSLASHQLRTPLSAIKWFTEMLISGDQGKLTKSQQENIKEISRGNERMIELVNALLNVSRLEVGKLKNEPVNLNVKTVANSVSLELEPTIESKEIAYNQTIQKLPNMYVDPKLIRIVIQNLLSNAVKYTPKRGSVRFTIREATADDISHSPEKPKSKQSVYFEVADTGYGIPESNKIRIFEKLYRADNVRRLDVDGTGLGLYIVREIVLMLGGVIWFESEENKGSKFFVIIPLKTLPSKNDTISKVNNG